jgi:hypothetical protein
VDETQALNKAQKKRNMWRMLGGVEAPAEEEDCSGDRRGRYGACGSVPLYVELPEELPPFCNMYIAV